MGSRFTIKGPKDYQLARDVCSYGFFVLWPNCWDPGARVFHRVLDLEGGPVRLSVRQEGAALRVAADRAMGRGEVLEAKRQMGRMLRLDEDEGTIAAFHRLDRRWKRGGQGRLLRSPTLFEDVVKTVTSCNVQWPSTVHMNMCLCRVLGRRVSSARAGDALPTHSFPTPAKMARTKATTLRSRCRVGYRDQRLVELARMFTSRGGRAAEVDEGWLEDAGTPDEDVHAKLLALPGIGPYAAANVMQLLGRYGRLPLDTESVRHGRTVLGFEGTDAQVMRQVAGHFERFGAHTFRSYWFEMWTHYEAKSGPAHEWDRRTVSKSFTTA